MDTFPGAEGQRRPVLASIHRKRKMEASLNTEWLDMLCQALVEHCIESVSLVSHHYWRDENDVNDTWHIEMYPALLLDPAGEVVYDLNVTLDFQELLKIVDDVTFLQAVADKITMCASFAGHEFNFEFLFEPPEDADVMGSLDAEGNVTPALPTAPESLPD